MLVLVGEFKKTSEFVACVISGSNRQLFMMGGKLNVGGVFAASVIERKWPLALVVHLFYVSEHATSAGDGMCQLLHHYHHPVETKWDWRTSVQCLWTLL